MKNSLQRLIAAHRCTLMACILAFSLLGCKKDPPPSSFDGNKTFNAPPVISGVLPAGGALAGVSIVTINGQNFSTVAGIIQVFFDTMQATIISNSVTQLVVRAPNVVRDSVQIKVSVLGAEQYSNVFVYKLQAAVSEFGGIPNTVEEPSGITCDASGNVYVALANATGIAIGFKKFTPSGVRSDFASQDGVPIWSGLKIGPGGELYGARNIRAVYKIPQGGVPRRWTIVSEAVYDFDFDSLRNIWAAGAGASIYRIKQDSTYISFPYPGDFKAVRVFRGYLYLGGKKTGDPNEQIVRAQILSSDNLGPWEQYYNLRNFDTTAHVNSLTFAADGDAYVGTDSSAGSIIVVHPDRTAEKLYPGLFKGKHVSFGFGVGSEMYISQTSATGASALKKILRVNMQKQSASYYGR